MFSELKKKMNAAEEIMSQLQWKISSANGVVESVTEELKGCDESDREWLKRQLDEAAAFLDMVDVVKDFLFKEVKKSM